MPTAATDCLLRMYDEHHELEDYQRGVPRWCTGCGDNAILAAVQRLCRDEQLRPEKTVFVSGIGCSSRFPHYMRTYGFHSIHGRALPIAEGIRIARPDLHVFVNTGDGDCCSIGAAHWIHAIRYNMNLTVFLHDNQIYGLTKMQASPTSPKGLKSNTTPRGAYLDALHPLTVTLGVQNVSFVAQAVDWIPEVLYDIVSGRVPSQGLVVRPHRPALPRMAPEAAGAVGARPGQDHAAPPRDTGCASARRWPRCTAVSRNTTRPICRGARDRGQSRSIPVGILYRNPDVPCYEDLRRPSVLRTPDLVKAGFEADSTNSRSGRSRGNGADMDAALHAHLTFHLRGWQPDDESRLRSTAPRRGPRCSRAIRILPRFATTFRSCSPTRARCRRWRRSSTVFWGKWPLARTPRGSAATCSGSSAAIRELVAEGAEGRLSHLWSLAAGQLQAAERRERDRQPGSGSARLEG